MLWAKIAVFAVVAFALMLPAVLIAFFASQAILSQHHILQISFSHPGVARVVIGGALYLMLIGIFALGIGAIVRNTAGGIATFAGDLLRDPAADEHPAVELEQRNLPIPADAAGRRMFSLRPGSRSPPVARIPALPWLHGAGGGDRRSAARAQGHLEVHLAASRRQDHARS